MLIFSFQKLSVYSWTPCIFLCPSLSVFLFMLQYKQQHTLLHKVNGALMLITFFVCRVLLFPYLYYAYGRYVLSQALIRFWDRGSWSKYKFKSHRFRLIYLLSLLLDACSFLRDQLTIYLTVYLSIYPGTRISPSTWCRCPFRGSITWVLLCSWLRRSTGSVWSAGERFASSPGPLAIIVPQSVGTPSLKPPSCPQPTVTVPVTQKESLTHTERHRGADAKDGAEAQSF